MMPAQIGWYFKYGSYQHDNAECWFSESRKLAESPDKKPMYTACRWDIFGRIQADTPSEVAVKVLALKQAYSQNHQDAGFYLAAGGATPHQVISAQTVRGVRVTAPPQFPESKGAEGTTFRNYVLTLEWEEPPPVVGMLVFEQSIRRIGTGGPDWDIVAGVKGRPIHMPKTEGSKVVVIQSGRTIGSRVPLPAPSPIWPNEPPLHGPSSQEDHFSIPGPALERVTTWSYTFFFPTAPNVWTR